jgi:hypothetical protein
MCQSLLNIDYAGRIEEYMVPRNARPLSTDLKVPSWNHLRLEAIWNSIASPAMDDPSAKRADDYPTVTEHQMPANPNRDSNANSGRRNRGAAQGR